jgi:hypothetical protein
LQNEPIWAGASFWERSQILCVDWHFLGGLFLRARPISAAA